MKRLFLLLVLLPLFFFPFQVGASEDVQRIAIHLKYSNSLRVMSHLKDTLEPSIFATLRKESDDTISSQLSKIHTFVLTVPSQESKGIIDLLRKTHAVSRVEYDAKASALSVTDDPDITKQYGLYTIVAARSNADSAWNITTGLTSIKAAIVDTGIDLNHPDLQGRVVASKDFTNSSNGYADGDGHGTHIAGIIAADGNNQTGGVGVAYNTSLVNAKVLDNTGSGYYSWIASGVIWSTDQGAKVINLSLGGSTDTQVLKDAIDYAWSKGVVVVAAAGNSGGGSAMYPAYYDNVIGVAATNAQDTRPSYSNYGAHVSVAAPGDKIYSTYKGSAYATMSGTSMSSAFVAGEAALLYAQGTCVTNTCVRSTILQSADQISGTGTYWTYGRINAQKALQLSSNYTDTVTPTMTPAPTDVPVTVTPSPTPEQSITPTVTPMPTVTMTPTPTPTPSSNELTVSAITLSKTSSFFIPQVTGSFIVKNTLGQPIQSALAKIRLISPSGIVYTSSKTTPSTGALTFSFYTFEKGTFTFKIDSITKSGYSYVPDVTQKTIVIN